MPNLVWKINCHRKKIFLTFDDGPTKGVTEEILDILDAFDAKATFFCLGTRVEENYGSFEHILKKGHGLGIHGYHHLNGWTTKNSDYINNVYKGAQIISTGLFRPPYGKITIRQQNVLSKDFQIIMWSNLSQDYNPNLSTEECFKKSIKNVDKGSIIVFHDSEKAEKNVLNVLPKTLAYLKDNNFIFSSIST